MGATTLVERRTTMQRLDQPSTRGRTWKRAGRRSRRFRSPHFLVARCLRLECHSSHTPLPREQSLISIVSSKSASFLKMATGYSGQVIGVDALVRPQEALQPYGLLE